MKQFEVKVVITKEWIQKANNREEAAKAIQELYPDGRVTQVDDCEIVGGCEISGKFIFEDDDYVSDDDGILILKSELRDKWKG